MARLISPHSSECIVHQLDVFEVEPTQTSVLNAQEIELKPSTPLSQNSDILEFRVPSDAGYYLDTPATRIMLTGQVTNADGSPIADDEKVSLTNNFTNTNFLQSDVLINGRRVSQTMKTYPWKAYIKVLCGHGDSSKKGILSALPWHQSDTNDSPDYDLWPSDKRSKDFVVCGPLFNDIFMIDKFLLSNVSLDIKLYRSDSAFCLNAETNKEYKFKLIDASLFVRKVQVSDPVIEAHYKVLNQNATAKYPMVRSEVKPFAISAGKQTCSIDSAYFGELPNRAMIMMVDEDAYNGSIKKNPFNFKHNNIRNITITYNGRVIPSKSYNLDFSTGKTVKAFNDLYDNTGQTGTSEPTLDISRKQFENGYTIFAFNFTPDMSDGSCGHSNLIQRGTMRIELDFRSKLPNPIVVLVYAEFDSLIEIDKDGVVSTDF